MMKSKGRVGGQGRAGPSKERKERGERQAQNRVKKKGGFIKDGEDRVGK